MGGMKKQTKRGGRRKLPACTRAGSCRRARFLHPVKSLQWLGQKGSLEESGERAHQLRRQSRPALAVLAAAPRSPACVDIQWRKRAWALRLWRTDRERGRAGCRRPEKGLEGSMAATGTCIWKKPGHPLETKSVVAKGHWTEGSENNSLTLVCAQSGCGLRSGLGVQWVCAQRDWARPGVWVASRAPSVHPFAQKWHTYLIQCRDTCELHRCENRAWGGKTAGIARDWCGAEGSASDTVLGEPAATDDRWHHRVHPVGRASGGAPGALFPSGAPHRLHPAPISQRAPPSSPQRAPHHLSAGALSPSGRPIVLAGTPSRLLHRIWKHIWALLVQQLSRPAHFCVTTTGQGQGPAQYLAEALATRTPATHSF